MFASTDFAPFVPGASPPPATLHVEAKNDVVAESTKDSACPKCGFAPTSCVPEPLSDIMCDKCGHKYMVPGRLADFIITGRLGAGEMGQVYKARDETLGRDVAIKVVRSAQTAQTQRDDERLREEARAAARLSHPHVAQVYLLGFANGHPYLVMELVRGEDMEARIEREGAFKEREVLRIAEEITDGLHALHQENLTHGDIKPANIIMSPGGSTKLVDFGLAGLSRHEGQSILGTPRYIAPESLRGAPDSRQTDLYSLGATLYHLLAGKPPFDGSTPSEVARARLERPADPIERHVPSLSESTRRIIMRMLEADPARRYPDCEAALKDIREARKRLNLVTIDMPKDVQAYIREARKRLGLPPSAGAS